MQIDRHLRWYFYPQIHIETVIVVRDSVWLQNWRVLFEIVFENPRWYLSLSVESINSQHHCVNNQNQLRKTYSCYNQSDKEDILSGILTEGWYRWICLFQDKGNQQFDKVVCKAKCYNCSWNIFRERFALNIAIGWYNLFIEFELQKLQKMKGHICNIKEILNNYFDK